MFMVTIFRETNDKPKNAGNKKWQKVIMENF